MSVSQQLSVLLSLPAESKHANINTVRVNISGIAANIFTNSHTHQNQIARLFLQQIEGIATEGIEEAINDDTAYYEDDNHKDHHQNCPTVAMHIYA